MYDRFVRGGFGKKKVGDIKYSDVLHFYHDLIHNKGIQSNTLDTIHTVLIDETVRRAYADVLANRVAVGAFAIPIEMKESNMLTNAVNEILGINPMGIFYAASDEIVSS